MRNSTAALLAGGLLLVSVAPFALAKENGNSQDNPGIKAARAEVTISANGKALVRGAHITTISGSSIMATTLWGQTSLAWTIHTGTSTQFVGSNERGIASAALAVGDTISFRGSLDQTATGLVVDAKVLKDMSTSTPRVKVKHSENTASSTEH